MQLNNNLITRSTINNLYESYKNQSKMDEDIDRIKDFIDEGCSLWKSKSEVQCMKYFDNAFKGICKIEIGNPKTVCREILPHLFDLFYHYGKICESQERYRDCANLMELSLLQQSAFFVIHTPYVIIPWQNAPTLELLLDQLNADILGRSLDIREFCNDITAEKMILHFRKFNFNDEMFKLTLVKLADCYEKLSSLDPTATKLRTLYRKYLTLYESSGKSIYYNTKRSYI